MLQCPPYMSGFVPKRQQLARIKLSCFVSDQLCRCASCILSSPYTSTAYQSEPKWAASSQSRRTPEDHLIYTKRPLQLMRGTLPYDACEVSTPFCSALRSWACGARATRPLHLVAALDSIPLTLQLNRHIMCLHKRMNTVARKALDGRCHGKLQLTLGHYGSDSWRMDCCRSRASLYVTTHIALSDRAVGGARDRRHADLSAGAQCRSQ